MRTSLLAVLLLSACGDDTSPATTDTQPSDSAEVSDTSDTSVDSSPDLSDTVPDTEPDTVPDADPDADPDIGADTASDIGTDTTPSAAEELCWATGGAWMAAACDCQQDGATTAMGYFFDPVLGCIPDPELLCEATGGVFEGECQCAQDGASLHYELHPRLGCSFPSDDELSADIASLELMELVERYASPSQRVWLIDNPGAFMVIHPMDSPADLLAFMAPGWTAISASAGACSGELEREVYPVVDCESDAGMDPTGCFLATTSDTYDRVSFLMQVSVDLDIADWTAEDIDRARADEGQILKLHVASSHRVTLGFRRLEGAWVLVVVDLARYACSA